METIKQRFSDSVFATSLIEPGMRAAAYRRWLRPMALLEASNDESFQASVVTYRLGRITVSLSTSSPAHYLRDEATLAMGRFKDCVLLRLLQEGRVQGCFGGSRIEIKEGDIYFTDLAQPSELWLEGDCSHINVMMQRSDMSEPGMHGRILHGEELPCRMLREHLLNFVQILERYQAADLKEMIRATMELLRFCLRSDNARGEVPDYFDQARERIVDYIDEHLSEDDLDARRLQHVFDVSRSQLYRLFAELGGIQHYIRNKRLQAVLRDLCNEPTRSITDIIERYGFSNERQFQRAFRSRFGMTASQVRAGWKSKSVADVADFEGL